MKHQTDLPERNEEKIVDLYNDGLATSAIAERFGCSGQVIRRILRSHGIKPTSTRHRYDGIGNLGTSHQ